MPKTKIDFAERNQGCKIKIKKATKLRLIAFGRFSSSYDAVLNELLDHVDKCQQYWEERS